MMGKVQKFVMMLGAVVVAATGAEAVQLDATACDLLKQEMSTLEKAGARSNFDKGAAWAKANLTADQIGQVERLIETEAQYLFRCPQPKRKYDPAIEAVMENGTGSDPDPDAVKPDATVKPGAAPAPGAKPAPPAAKPKPKPATAATAATTNDTGETPPPKPKRAAAKPKPADAFNPETAARPGPPAAAVPQ